MYIRGYCRAAASTVHAIEANAEIPSRIQLDCRSAGGGDGTVRFQDRRGYAAKKRRWVHFHRAAYWRTKLRVKTTPAGYEIFDSIASGTL